MKINILKLAWLGGVIDSDGSIGLYEYIPTKRYKRVVRPMITIVNTNILFINEIRNIVDSLEIPYYFTKVVRKKGKYETWKDVYKIVFQNKHNCKALLNVMKDYLISKREQASLVLEFCKRRTFSPQTDIEKILYTKIRILNKKGK